MKVDASGLSCQLTLRPRAEVVAEEEDNRSTTSTTSPARRSAAWKGPEVAESQGQPRVSVCMATYNGSRFVRAQLASILTQLAPNDEVIIVDDASTDNTLDIVKQIGDARCKVVVNASNAGYVQAFEQSLSLSAGEYVVLSDQDDVWPDGRLQALVSALEYSLVAVGKVGTLGGPNSITDPFGRPNWRLREADSKREARNIAGILMGMRPYFGAATAVHRDALQLILPFPPFLRESHDLWIAIVGNMCRSMRHIEQVVVHRRYHDSNASPSRPRALRQVLRARVMLLRCVIVARRRRSAITARSRPN